MFYNYAIVFFEETSLTKMYCTIVIPGSLILLCSVLWCSVVLSRIHTLFKERLFTIVYVLYMIILQYYGIYESSMVLPRVLRSQGQSQVLSSHTLYRRALNVLYKNMYDDSKDG